MNTFSGLKSVADSDYIVRFTTATAVDSAATTESNIIELENIQHNQQGKLVINYLLFSLLKLKIILNTFSGLKSGADSDSIIRFTTTTTVDSSSTTESNIL